MPQFWCPLLPLSICAEGSNRAYKRLAGSHPPNFNVSPTARDQLAGDVSENPCICILAGLTSGAHKLLIFRSSVERQEALET